MNIRAATSADFKAIRACDNEAFGQRAEGKLTERLRADGDAEIELVADAKGRIVGHILLSRLAAPEKTLALAPLAVLPDRQKKGIGAALVTEAARLARDAGWNAIFLLGSPAYYSRFGFKVEDAAKFETIYPKEYMMALELRPGALAALSGGIVYAPAFADLG